MDESYIESLLGLIPEDSIVANEGLDWDHHQSAKNALSSSVAG